MLQRLLCKFFAKMFYPTNRIDWYKIKKYQGGDHASRFADFVAVQKRKGSRFYQDFQSLKLTRQYIMSGDKKLDSVLMVPSPNIAKGKVGSGLYFILFQGRGEYYECRFRDMARQAQETGASVLGFNPKGFKSSTGKTQRLSDIVDDGIAVVEFLLRRGVRYEQIIVQGNSLGAGVQEMVSEHYRVRKGYPLRQINSNSFKSFAAVFARHYNTPFLEKLFGRILQYAEWEIMPGPDFYRLGPYRCHLRRLGDGIIVEKAEYHSMVNFQGDHDQCPKSYKATHGWLYEHSQLTYMGTSKKDPHMLSLHHFGVKEQDTGQYISVYEVINRYLEASIKNAQ